uniref:C2 domain-containing protein n=2 Tax=Hemiselmis andersenii TaxID=464988 RepID=A0A7S1HHL6_HEMAN
MDETLHEIDQFERRLEIKTREEGLKHKAAATDMTPNMVTGASRVTVDDFTERIMQQPLDSPTTYGDTLQDRGSPPPQTGGFGEGGGTHDDSPPPIQAPMGRGVPYTKPAEVPPVVKSRTLVLKVLHASGLKEPPLPWREVVGGAPPPLLCNPKCMVRYHRQLASGGTVKGSRNPVFNDSFTFHAPKEGALGGVTVEVVTVERGANDTLIGSVVLEIDSLPGVLDCKPVQKWVNLGEGGEGSLHCEACLIVAFEDA